MGFSSALSAVMGIVIGSGIFFKATVIYKTTGGAPGLGMIGWIVGGLLSLAGALTASEISAAIIRTGGLVSYIEYIYGEKMGFLAGWMDSMIFQVASTAAAGVAFGMQTVNVLGLDENNHYLRIGIAIATIIFLTVLNNMGSKIGGTIQIVSTVAKLIPIIILIYLGFTRGTNTEPMLSPLLAPGIKLSVAGAPILLGVLYAFDGWLGAGQLAGEMKNPQKDLPRALVLGIFFIGIIYYITNMAFLKTMPASEIANFEAPAAEVARVLLGPTGHKFISIGIMVSVFGGLNGYIFTAPRSTYFFGAQGIIPGGKWLATPNKNGAPGNSTIFICVLSCLYALTGKFDLLTDLLVFTVWIFYTLVFLGVFILRKREPQIKRPYKVPFYPIIPLFAVLGGIFLLITTFIASPTDSLIAVLLVLIGYPVYLFQKSRLNKI